MCAILGLLTRARDACRPIGRMTALLRHRGPDDEGYILVSPGGAVCLGGEDTPPEVYRADIPFRPTGKVGPQSVVADAWLALVLSGFVSLGPPADVLSGPLLDCL